MKITKNQLFISIFSVAIILISLAIMVCDFVVPLNIWTHPVLTFIFCLSVGFFILCVIVGALQKSVWFLFLSAICATFVIMYPFAHYDFWWIGLIVTVVAWALIGISSFMLMGSKTEAIALNAYPEYEDYKTRAKSKSEDNEREEQEELPKIKLFKD